MCVRNSQVLLGPQWHVLFGIGVFAVVVSVALEKGVYLLWEYLSPETAGVFFSEQVSMANFSEVLSAAGVSFLIIALIEEGSKYLMMRRFMRKAQDMDQIIDGVQLGIATGLGFAFLENTFYFLKLFRGYEFDVLVIVFFCVSLFQPLGICPSEG